MSEYAGSGAKPTTLTADGVASDRKGRFCGILINPTGAVTPTVTVYDNASAASGTKLATVKIVSGTPFFLSFGEEGVDVINGVFVAADAWTTLNATVYTKA